MRKTLGLLAILVLVVGGFGYYRGWFTVKGDGDEGTSNVTFGLDKEKVKHDTDLTVAGYAAKLKQHDGTLGDLEQRAKEATGDSKEDLEDQAKELRDRHGTLAKKLDELESATGAKYDQLKSELKTGLDGLGGDLEKAIAGGGKK